MASKDQKDKSRQYKPSTVRRLDTLSGNECAHPECTKKLIAEDLETMKNTYINRVPQSANILLPNTNLMIRYNENNFNLFNRK